MQLLVKHWLLVKSKKYFTMIQKKKMQSTLSVVCSLLLDIKTKCYFQLMSWQRNLESYVLDAV